ncbi:MAG TPA: redoxin domain-containing protein [Methanomicrobia archaeon]|nr:redoxin domain-containing protein [Methanomicrobia archaeon]
MQDRFCRGAVPERESSHRAALVLFVLMLSALAITACSPVAGAARPEAPPFSLTSLEGTSFNLSDFRGSVVVLDLMATWCPVCKDEMPELVQLRQARPEVVIITISVDPTEDDTELRAFKEHYAADWRFTRDTDRVWEKYREFYIPAIVVIEPQGYISFRKAGLVPIAELIAEVDRASAGVPGEPEEPAVPAETSTTPFGLYALAFLTGLLSFFAPCAFPLLPGYISYYLGRAEGGTTLRSSLKAGSAAASGINGIFALIGIAVALGGAVVKSYLSYLTPVVGVAIIVLGLLMLLGPSGMAVFAQFEGLLSAYATKLGGRSSDSGLVMYGAGYGLAVMGCQAPVFIALIFAGLAAGGAVQAILVFLVFSLGMGCMMIAVSLLAGTAKRTMLDRLKALMPYINRACGLVLILVGLYFLREFF